MRGKPAESRKGQVIMFFICLFVVTGSLCGCIVYGILKPDILINFAAETIYGKKTLYFFCFIICVSLCNTAFVGF